MEANTDRQATILDVAQQNSLRRKALLHVNGSTKLLDSDQARHDWQLAGQ